MPNKISLFLDSGAYSAWSQGIEIDIYKYIDFIKEHKQYIDVYANLDVIGNEQATWKNQKIMEGAGLEPLPVFHVEDNIKYLHKCVNEYDHFCLGGMAKGFTTSQRMVFLDMCFGIICDTSDRMPKSKIHGFGMTSLKLMFRYPWYSVDSTSWVLTSRMGSIYVPKYKNGQFIYNEDCWKICLSSRSPGKEDAGKHFDTLPNNVQDKIKEYLFDRGYKIGKSEFRRVDEKKYKLEENEKYCKEKRAQDGTREVETIVEDGLCNSYKLRDEVNIIYYLDLEKSMPAWPWPYKPKGMQGFKL